MLKQGKYCVIIVVITAKLTVIHKNKARSNKGGNEMRMKKVFKMLMATLMIAGLLVSPASAAEEKSVDWGDKAYTINVPGFIEGRDITVDGKTTPAIVVEKPENKSDNRYNFFEIVTTDPKAVMVTSSLYTSAFEELGDFMGELEGGRVAFTPTLYEAFEDVSGQPLYLGFSFRNDAFEVIYEFPLWVVFEEGKTSAPAPTPEPTPAPETTPAPEPAPAPAPVKEVTAQPTSSKVIVDDKQIAFEAYTINGNNYFKLRDLAQAVTGSEKQFEVTWDGAKNAINLISKEAYTSVGNELTPGSGAASVKGVTNQSKIYIDGEELALEAYTINGNNYFKLRDVAAVFDFGVAWDGAQNQIVIDTAVGYTE